MIATFLRAEVDSSRFGAPFQQALVRQGHSLDVLRCPDTSDSAANRLRRELLETYRGWGQEESVFGGLPADRVTWQWVELTEHDVAERVFYIRWFWEDYSGGSRRPADVARRIRRGVPAEDRNVIDAILANVRGGQVPPEPILLAEPGMERLVILEGHVRFTAYLVEPKVVPFPLRVLVGIAPDIAAWSEW